MKEVKCQHIGQKLARLGNFHVVKKYAQKNQGKGWVHLFASLELTEANLWTSNIFSLKEVIFADLFKYKIQSTRTKSPKT